MSASDLTKTEFAFKITYSRFMKEAVARRRPTWDLLKKTYDWTGLNDFRYPVMIANPQGVGGTFSGAKNNATHGSTGDQFTAGRRSRFGYGTIDSEALRASRNDNGAFFRLADRELRGTLAEHEDTLDHSLFRNATGARGRIAASGGVPGGGVIVLANRYDLRWIKVNMTLIGSPNANGSSPRVGDMIVQKVNFQDGEIVVDATAASLANNDYLFRKSEDANTSAPPDGFQSVIPLAADLGTFRGVDQTVDRERYAGWCIEDPDTNPEDNVAELITQMGAYDNFSNRNMLVVMHPVQAQRVCKRANGKRIYIDTKGKPAQIGFGAWEIETPMGAATLLPDGGCVLTDGWVLTPSSWEIKALDALPHLNDEDGNMTLRQSDGAGVEYRTQSFSNLICYEPYQNGRFTMNS
jgi:hypothetical protein